jgi:CheY-like chemotaxis protein
MRCNAWPAFLLNSVKDTSGKANSFLGCSRANIELNMNICADLEKESETLAGPPTWRCDAAGQNFSDLRQLGAQNGVAAALTPVGRHRPRFLVVEDMAELADLLVQCLEALEIEVEVAATGEAALLLLSRGSFDVALVDIELPDTTGFEVMAIARESGWLRNTHVVFCTGSRSEEYRQRAARFSGSSFLWKPFTVQNLVKCIENVPSAPMVGLVDGTTATRADHMGPERTMSL